MADPQGQPPEAMASAPEPRPAVPRPPLGPPPGPPPVGPPPGPPPMLRPWNVPLLAVECNIFRKNMFAFVLNVFI